MLSDAFPYRKFPKTTLRTFLPSLIRWSSLIPRQYQTARDLSDCGLPSLELLHQHSHIQRLSHKFFFHLVLKLSLNLTRWYVTPPLKHARILQRSVLIFAALPSSVYVFSPRCDLHFPEASRKRHHMTWAGLITTS